MQFYSTNSPKSLVDLEEAVLRSLPADNGLYMPEEIIPFEHDFFEHIESMSFVDIAYEIAKKFIGGESGFSDEEIHEIVAGAVNFEAPTVQLDDNLSVLELFHGPSLAFKDFGARFMSRVMGKLTEKHGKKLHILVATSGDTGGAVALGFYKVPNVDVTILYPSGRVSDLQEKQLTTLGENIQAIEIEGSFDDCQTLVKQAFLDSELNEHYLLSSANSINISRLIPQIFYYFRSYQQAKQVGKDLYFCVPSGNFGNLTAGIMAWRLGLPVKGFIAANNANDPVVHYLKTGDMNKKKSVATLSNAMDVGNPSNFVRLSHLLSDDHNKIRTLLAGYSFSDNETQQAMKELHKKYDYITCPHTAVGYLGAREFLSNNDNTHVIMHATAHTAKFLDTVESTLGTAVNIPEQLSSLMGREKDATLMKPEFASFKKYLGDHL